jgi:ATP-dependent Zn protease
MRDELETTNPDRKLIAYHEAGHAVAAAKLGVDFERISLVARKGSLGESLLLVMPQRTEIERAIVVALAGFPAQELVARNIEAGGIRGAERDHEIAVRLAQLVGIAADDLRGLVASARALIHDNHASVRAVAEALLERETLTLPEVHELVRLVEEKNPHEPEVI